MKIGILGATGYTGAELAVLVERHPELELAFVSSEASAGQKLESVFPALRGLSKLRPLTLRKAEECQSISVDAVFSCLPHTASAKSCLPFVDAGAVVIDLSADFRLKDAADFLKWYDHEHPAPARLAEAVYGLTEWNREVVRGGKLIANPGCYPTSVLLPLLPLFTAGLVGDGAIIADSKSGVSGAGRKASLGTSFCEVDGSFSAYKIGRKHQHMGEMTQALRGVSKSAPQFVFSPHLVPMERGILSTIYVPLAPGHTGAQVREALAARYAGEPFVHVLAASEGLPATGHVRHTNRCHIAVTELPEQDLCIVVSAIDNLIKGASGQALQNLNVACGMAETLGLA